MVQYSKSIFLMDSISISTQERSASVGFSDDSTSWTIVKDKKKSVKGIWSFTSSRKHTDYDDLVDGGVDSFIGRSECGFFKFNKKKDSLKLYLTGLEGCYEKEAAKGKKQLIGEIKGSDFEDIFNSNAGSFDITGTGSSSTVNGESSVEILYEFGFKTSSNDDSGPYTVDLDPKYMKGLGKYENKMEVRGELLSTTGLTVTEFESMFV